MRIIMVPVADRPESIAALRSAFAIATRLEANVEAFHVRPHRYSEVFLPAEASFLVSGAALEEQADALEETAARASDAAHVMVDTIAQVQGFELVKRFTANSTREIRWSEQVGDVQSLLSVMGPFADMLVVSRPKTRASRTARLFMSNAVLHSSRPVLILPPSGARSIGRRIVIAWDRTHEAMRAVVAALPLLAHAEHVSIFTSAGGKKDGPKAQPLKSYLAAWGIKASISRTRGAGADVIADIEEHYRDTDADLLVMGAYSRHRLRERVFGGVTHHMLYNARHPVFTIHT